MNRRSFLELALSHRSDSSSNGGIAHTTEKRTDLPSLLGGGESTLERYVPSSEDPWDYRKAAHLLRRCVVGPTHREIERAVTEGLDATLDRLFAGFEPTDDSISTWIGTVVQTHVSFPDGSPGVAAFVSEKLGRRERLGKWWLRVIAESPLSLQERMTFFWHNHFVTTMGAVEFAQWMHVNNELLRHNALGNFRSLVEQVTVDPAMLHYLDGERNYRTSTISSINENYSRELLELFTMGVYDWDGNPNYTQQDVAEGARALSGWGIVEGAGGPFWKELRGEFVEQRWDNAEKIFMGERGRFNTDDIIELIFRKRPDQIAKFICEKLYRAFVYDRVDRTIAAGMAETFRSGEWEIAPVVRQLLSSRHFFDPLYMGCLTKSSHDLLCGVLRELAITEVPDFQSEGDCAAVYYLSEQLLRIGQMPLHPPSVKGWPGGRSWVNSSTFSARVKVISDIARGRMTTGDGSRLYRFDPLVFARSFAEPNDIRGLSERITAYFLSSPPSAEEKEHLYQVLLDGGKEYEWDLDDSDQHPGLRIMKLLEALFLLPKYQLY